MADKPATGYSRISANLALGAVLRSHGRTLRSVSDRVMEESVLKSCGFRMERAKLSPEEQQRQDERLLKACTNGSLADLEAALAAGANPNARAGNGWTPLMLAIWNEFLPLERRLINVRADVNAKGREGRTAAMLAACNKNGSYLAWVAEIGKADLSALDNNGWSALMLAAKENIAENVRQILLAGQSRDADDVRRALEIARQEGSGDAARELESCLIGGRT